MFLLAGNAILIYLFVTSSFNLISSEPIEIAQSSKTKSTIEVSKRPTITKTSTKTKSPIPTTTLAPTNEPTETPKPTDIVEEEDLVVEDKNNNQEIVNYDSSLIGQVNTFRASKGLAPFSTDTHTCSFANTRASEISSSFNHDGFSQRIDSNSLPYPSYTQIAENIAMNPDPNAVIPGWVASGGHNENMSKNAPFGCVGQSGQYYVLEVWAP